MTEQFANGLRVLVVDDEDLILMFLRQALGDMGFVVEQARSLAEANEARATERFDLFILDKNLPDGSGLELAREFAQGDHDAEVVLMSAYANLSSAFEAIQCQVADYLVKPFDMSDLCARLQRIVEGQTLKRTNRSLLDQLRRKNEILETLATRDTLTELFNHTHFQDSVQRELIRSRRHHLCFSVVFLDVDGFRRVNEIAGHARGDTILRTFGRILLDDSRQSDVLSHLSEQDLAARYGGDRFSLLLPQTTKTGAAVKAERLRHTTEHYDFGIPGSAGLTLSIGIAGFPDDASTRDDLLNAAATGLEAAKGGGGNRVVSYTPDLARAGKLEPAMARMEAARLAALDRTIAEHAFGVAYQPIVDVDAWAVLGYEALCRPADPAFPTPVAIFATAERCGRIAALGHAVREEALKPLAELPEPRLLFLNLQPHEFLDPTCVEAEPFLLPWASQLVFEITEGSQIHDFDRARERIAGLRRQGFRVAVDDLGAGYSSLNSLALLAPDFVKLDMALVRGIHSDSRSARLIKHIIEFCREEGLAVIAEGVETVEELEVVSALGVPLVQGYYLARPAPPFPAIQPRPPELAGAETAAAQSAGTAE